MVAAKSATGQTKLPPRSDTQYSGQSARPPRLSDCSALGTAEVWVTVPLFVRRVHGDNDRRTNGFGRDDRHGTSACLVHTCSDSLNASRARKSGADRLVTPITGCVGLPDFTTWTSRPAEHACQS